MPQGRQEGRAALLSAVGIWTQSYGRATDGFDDAVGRRLDLNPTDLRGLDWLTTGAMSAGELGEATGLSSPATTTLLDRLERKGFVQRQRDTVDRRKVLIELTPAGRAQIDELYGRLALEGGRLLGRFSDDELAKLRDFLVEATALVNRHRDQVLASIGSLPDRPDD